MAIEEHEKFSEWCEALDDLVKKRDLYLKAKAFGARHLEAEELALFSAMRRYNEISDEIDA